MGADVTKYRTLALDGQMPLSRASLTFEPIPLAPRDAQQRAPAPWGFSCGPLAIHSVTRIGRGGGALRFRVSAKECGGAIADFRWIEAAIGFALALRNLDWSGGRQDVEKIVRRNAKAVQAAWRERSEWE